MLGTTRKELRPYVSFGESRNAAERKQDIARAREHGFSAFKLRFRAESLEADLDVVRDMRETYGDTIELMVDANQALVTPGSRTYRVWDFKTARYVADALADLGALWLEEPLPDDHEDDMAELRRVSRIPIAGGELRTGTREFMPLITGRLYDIVQPDVTYGGGILGCRKIATIAEAAGLRVIPHTWSNGLGWLANFHLACSILSCDFIETPMDPPTLTLEDFMFPLASGWRIDPRTGTAMLPEGPGLGADVRDDVAAAVREGR
jgi:L-alanine-DL-glutamate epimerase-like enolase superfamily enzyme